MKPLLDIIVTHNNEPWEVGKKFFDMLALQRDADLSKCHVCIIQDGAEGNLDWNNLIPKTDIQYRIVTIDHAGPAAARNAGIKTADAEWVMFCDFDDMFANVCALKLILNVLTKNDVDMTWFETWQEETREKYFVNVLKENVTSTNGKIYRLSTIRKNNITFDTRFEHLYESVFNSHLLDIIPPHRVKHIKMPCTAYMKTLRKNSYNVNRNALSRTVNEMMLANIVNTENAVAERRPESSVALFVCDAMFDAYFAMNSDDSLITNETKRIFYDFVIKHRHFIESIDKYSMEVSLNSAAVRTDMFVQSMYNTFQLELLPPIDALDVAIKWVHSVCDSAEEQYNDIKSQEVITPSADNSERVVVYCGTRNVYEYMVVSAKSLLQHTQVDKIYFLTEDDVFPQELPAVIENMNVSDQAFFHQSGPNYNNTWSYMCLMRAAFAKLLPQHKRVLSLDVDVSIVDDISELFDIDMSGYYLAGVHEPVRTQSDYINFGVVMMNLDEIRRDHIDDKVISALNMQTYDCPEQSAFSEICTGHIKLLPAEYNYTPCGSITGETKTYKIIHYAGIKYWKHYKEYRKYKDQPFQTAWSETTSKRRVAAYIGTRNQYDMMFLSAKSLLANTKMDEVFFLIEDDAFPEQLPPCITCINISNQPFFSKDGPNYNSPFSYVPMLRAAYPKLFPSEQLVLSLDNDTIIEEDISSLFDTDLSDYYFAAALEARPGRKVQQPYYNTGVMLMNLDKMRRDGIDDQTIADLNVTYYMNDSQDALNVSCKDYILLIPSDYNAAMFTEPTSHVAIRHLAGSKKPYFDQFAKPYDKPWSEILQKGE